MRAGTIAPHPPVDWPQRTQRDAKGSPCGKSQEGGEGSPASGPKADPFCASLRSLRPTSQLGIGPVVRGADTDFDPCYELTVLHTSDQGLDAGKNPISLSPPRVEGSRARGSRRWHHYSDSVPGSFVAPLSPTLSPLRGEGEEHSPPLVRLGLCGCGNTARCLAVVCRVCKLRAHFGKASVWSPGFRRFAGCNRPGRIHTGLPTRRCRAGRLLVAPPGLRSRASIVA